MRKLKYIRVLLTTTADYKNKEITTMMMIMMIIVIIIKMGKNGKVKIAQTKIFGTKL